MSSITKDNV
ncbi:02042160-045e-49c4-b905-f27411b2fdcb [Thermothielavioides terrestris]|uniref:02042160-045e-49c4-b905-f27411b2fdcb n=1 Tax=Thermothielavioides terrestris TaxID=2587410 RepID=A0A3S4BI43_9PEZI|nr:02042160-045e-49c4-b905-f27411b2fdcb [Thermothielavioides terrestris]